MPYAVYKLIHFAGIFTMLVALAIASVHVLRGGTRADNPQRRAIGIAHGIASFLILLGGFGMLARLGIVQGGLPPWILAKLGIWVVLSGALMVAYRGDGLARAVLLGTPVLALIAGAIALYKPF